mmetsp:Transcript_32384/g.44911  ORF Transcript_32384/g.44911 Transcript_32384/m.44911 type:complete len:351 (-) Transcript_32384:92-1144(-)|eukprot:CAMPEP_0196584878 /NCGR_PEP_ID=MMETSP1081-20130531/48836_1 /TAXON_ID=36882 /ORGANISM="Pyramimonas amylifera, Strain CCMP720" /LENGTH=350 /DNA_ID=CAMNT_0041906249 /DNA_START=226 /DNA_END=1278 /DNA_ORIENTATION=-
MSGESIARTLGEVGASPQIDTPAAEARDPAPDLPALEHHAQDASSSPSASLSAVQLSARYHSHPAGAPTGSSPRSLAQTPQGTAYRPATVCHPYTIPYEPMFVRQGVFGRAPLQGFPWPHHEVQKASRLDSPLREITKVGHKTGSVDDGVNRSERGRSRNLKNRPLPPDTHSLRMRFPTEKILCSAENLSEDGRYWVRLNKQWVRPTTNEHAGIAGEEAARKSGWVYNFNVQKRPVGKKGPSTTLLPPVTDRFGIPVYKNAEDKTTETEAPWERPGTPLFLSYTHNDLSTQEAEAEFKPENVYRRRSGRMRTLDALRLQNEDKIHERERNLKVLMAKTDSRKRNKKWISV